MVYMCCVSEYHSSKEAVEPDMPETIGSKYNAHDPKEGRISTQRYFCCLNINVSMDEISASLPEKEFSMLLHSVNLVSVGNELDNSTLIFLR